MPLELDDSMVGLVDGLQRNSVATLCPRTFEHHPYFLLSAELLAQTKVKRS